MKTDLLQIVCHEATHALHAFCVGFDVTAVSCQHDRGHCTIAWPFQPASYLEAFESNPAHTLLQTAQMLTTLTCPALVECLEPAGPDRHSLLLLYQAYRKIGTQEEWTRLASEAERTMRRWVVRPEVTRSIEQLALCLYQQPTMSTYAWQSALEVSGAMTVPCPAYAIPAFPRAWRPKPYTAQELGKSRDVREWWPSLQGEARPSSHGHGLPWQQPTSAHAMPAPAPEPGRWVLKPRLLKPRSGWRSGSMGALAY